jgi:putative tricarboxylic transport membrane protein
MGTLATRQYAVDMWITVGLSTFCFLLTPASYPMPSVLLGVILELISERGFRRAMLLSCGDWKVFFTSSICVILLIFAVLSVHAGLRMSKMERKLAAKASQ